jgi:hypothetical protein
MKTLISLSLAICLNSIPAVYAQHNSSLVHPSQQMTRLKSTWSAGQKLDSTVYVKWDTLADHFVYTLKSEYAYDGMGNCSQLTSYRWDQTGGEWKGNYREVSEYYAPGKQLLSVFQEWDSISGQFVNSSKETNQWDGKGRDIGYESYDWSKARELWKPIIKYEKNYDGNGFRNLDAYYYGDTITGQWVGERKVESTLDIKGQITEVVISYWDIDNNQWLPSRKEVNTWNPDGMLLFYMHYEYDAGKDQWVEKLKKELVYNNDETPDLFQTYEWVESKGAWIIIRKDVYLYDDQGRETSVTSTNWNSGTEALIYAGKVETVYDANGLITITSYSWDLASADWIPANKQEYTLSFSLLIYYTWDSLSGQWKGDSKYEKGISNSGIVLYDIYSEWDDSTSMFVPTDSVGYSFDLNGNPSVYTSSVWNTISGGWIFNYKHEYSYNEEGNIVLDARYNWDNDTLEWKDSEKITWYYSEHTFTPVPGINNGQLRVYPNPASEYVVFDLEDMSPSAAICLFDSQGRLVLQHRLSVNQPVPVGNLAPGIYIYRLADRGKTYQGKIEIK